MAIFQIEIVVWTKYISWNNTSESIPELIIHTPEKFKKRLRNFEITYFERRSFFWHRRNQS